MKDLTTPLPPYFLNQEGRILDGRYRLRALIGQGGTGAVYEAEHLKSGRLLAVKMLLPNLPDVAQVAERFRLEARAATMLDHPNIIEVLDLVSEDNTLYLVMELLRGKPLGELIDAGPIAPRRTLVIVRQVLEGLIHAHSHGIVHRDLKPDNILLVTVGEQGREYERVKLLDFGLLKLIGDAAAGSKKLTRTGLVVGTPEYLAPEQALGRPIDGRTDLYSLGIVVFEMLTGRVPFDSPDPQTIMRMHVTQQPPTLASAAPDQSWCTSELEYLVAHSLTKDPGHRFADAAEMMRALEAAFISLDHLPAE